MNRCTMTAEPCDPSTWACSSAGRAPRSQRGGQRFDPAQVHHLFQSLAFRQTPFTSQNVTIESQSQLTISLGGTTLASRAVTMSIICETARRCDAGTNCAYMSMVVDDRLCLICACTAFGSAPASTAVWHSRRCPIGTRNEGDHPGPKNLQS